MKKKIVKKFKYQNVGHCPQRNSEDLSYADTELEGESLGYKFACNDCDYEGIEWYDLKYSETI